MRAGRCRPSSLLGRRLYRTDMKELMQIYEQSLRRLEQRHAELTSQRVMYDKRVLLLEEEIDELWEAMSMMRPYLEG